MVALRALSVAKIEGATEGCNISFGATGGESGALESGGGALERGGNFH